MVKRASAKRVVGFFSTNRYDILERVEKIEIRPNSIDLTEGHLVWETSPSELLKIARDFKKLKAKNYWVVSYFSRLSLRKPSRYSSLGLTVRRSSTYYPEGSLTISPLKLEKIAEQLSKAKWERKLKSCIYGSDRKIFKAVVGDDVITFIWTPERDKNGEMQISRMVWDAWQLKAQQDYVREVETQRLPHFLKLPNFLIN